MTRLLSRGSLPMFLMLAMLAGPLLADAAAQVSVPGTYPTIQAAIDAVLSGTTINVQPGTYPETLFIANTSRSTRPPTAGQPCDSSMPSGAAGPSRAWCPSLTSRVGSSAP